MRQLSTFDVEAIHVGSRRRQPSAERVQELAESIARHGLQTPITVRMVDRVDIPGEGEVWHVPVLVAGAGRLAAVKSLIAAGTYTGDQIEAYSVELNDRQAEMLEIVENLHRLDLSALERDEWRARYIELWQAEEADASDADKPAQVGPVSKGGRGKEGGVNKASRDLGIKRSTAQRAVKRSHEITSEARDAIRNTPLDIGKYLNGLMKVPEAEQLAKVQADLKVANDKLERQRRRDEQQQREKEAKEARHRAVEGICELLCDKLMAKDWDTLIRLMDDAGWPTQAKALRTWMSPSQDAAA